MDAFLKLHAAVKKSPFSVFNALVLVALAMSMFINMQYQRTILEIAASTEKTVNPTETRIVTIKNESDVRITRILEHLRVTTNADRAKLFQYHNGEKSIGGIPFLYVSNTHEIVGPGTSSEISRLQKLPSSLFIEAAQTTVDVKVCSQVTELTNKGAQEILISQGAKIVCTLPVYIDNDIVGIVSLNYTINNPRSNLGVSKELQDATIRVSEALRDSIGE